MELELMKADGTRAIAENAEVVAEHFQLVEG